MGKPIRVKVKKEVLDWAIKESQRDQETITKKFTSFDKWISGEKDPTFKQLEGLANYLKVPFGYMFLENPPRENVMEMEFRTINNKLPQMSKNLKDTIKEMDKRRSWMSDYRANLGWEKLDIISQFEDKKNEDVVKDAALVKDLLGLEEYWYKSVGSCDEAYKVLRGYAEDAGILVMQNGVVGSDNHRLLNIDEFRAFTLYDDVAPLVFINSRDTKAGKLFSLVHEIIHVLRGEENLFMDIDTDSIIGKERYINKVTAEFLIPENHIRELWEENKDIFSQIDEMSSFFMVSKLALSIKLMDIDLIEDHRIIEKIKEKSIMEFNNKRNESDGGNFYHTYGTRVSHTFQKAVIRSAEIGDISYTHAFNLLGIKKGKTYDGIKERLMGYEY